MLEVEAHLNEQEGWNEVAAHAFAAPLPRTEEAALDACLEVPHGSTNGPGVPLLVDRMGGPVSCVEGGWPVVSVGDVFVQEVLEAVVRLSFSFPSRG